MHGQQNIKKEMQYYIQSMSQMTPLFKKLEVG